MAGVMMDFLYALGNCSISQYSHSELDSFGREITPKNELKLANISDTIHLSPRKP